MKDPDSKPRAVIKDLFTVEGKKFEASKRKKRLKFADFRKSKEDHAARHKINMISATQSEA